ncbi:MAG: YfcC family protein [Psychrilyobacter sp.]|nr:YfcC family protein [Psychrilyobacter sp.]
MKEKKKFQMPTAYTILFSIIAIVAIFTWVVPAGQYDFVEGSKQPIPGTYHVTDSNPQGLWEVINAPINGFYEAKDIALFVLVIGGFLGIVMKTGAIDAGIGHVIKKLKGREKIMIPILMTIFAAGGTSFGLAEETIAFYPLLIPVFIGAGYDSLTAVGVIMLGAGVGVLASTVNPFATGVASGFAEISIGDGIGLRLIMLVVLLGFAIFYMMRYAEKVKNDPTKSLVYDQKKENEEHFLGADAETTTVPELTKQRKLILCLFGGTFIVMIFGVIPWAYKFNITIFEDINNFFLGLPGIGHILGGVVPLGDWWFGEMTVLFMVSSILIAKVYGMSEKELVAVFVQGARDLLGVALIVGVSRGITIVMNAGGMTNTVLYWGEQALTGVGATAFAIISYLFYLPMSFLIPSTSGLATLSMPIMAPLGEFSGLAKSVVVTGYQSASGVLNLITPTSAVVMGGLAIGRVSYGKWIKFVMPFFIATIVITMVMLAIGSMM